MNFFQDKGLVDELHWFIDCLVEDKVKFKAALHIDSDTKKPYATINNGRVTLIIKRVAKTIQYMIRDDDMINHARREGFTEAQIKENIKCMHIVDIKLAEIMICNPTFLADSKKDLIKENLAKNKEEST